MPQEAVEPESLASQSSSCNGSLELQEEQGNNYDEDSVDLRRENSEIVTWLNRMERQIQLEEAKASDDTPRIGRSSLVKVVGTGTCLDGNIVEVTGVSSKYLWICHQQQCYRIKPAFCELHQTSEDVKEMKKIKERAASLAAAKAEAEERSVKEEEERIAALALADAKADELAEQEATRIAEALAGVIPEPPPEQATKGVVGKGCWVTLRGVSEVDSRAIGYVTGLSKRYGWVVVDSKMLKLKCECMQLHAEAPKRARRASSFARLRRRGSFKSTAEPAPAPSTEELSTQEMVVAAEALTLARQLKSRLQRPPAEEVTEDRSRIAITKKTWVRVLDPSIPREQHVIGFVTGLNTRDAWVAFDGKVWKVRLSDLEFYSH